MVSGSPAPVEEGFAFPKGDRLRTDREYREVVRKGERAHSPHFTFYRDGKGGAGRKVGISAGRKVGNAVLRNRIKRLLRECVRLRKEAFPKGSRTAIVVRAFPPGATLSSVSTEVVATVAKRWGSRPPAPPPPSPAASPSS